MHLLPQKKSEMYFEVSKTILSYSKAIQKLYKAIQSTFCIGVFSILYVNADKFQVNIIFHLLFHAKILFICFYIKHFVKHNSVESTFFIIKFPRFLRTKIKG